MSTDAYLDAKSAFEKADKAMDELAASITQISIALQRNRGKFCFSNTGVGLPMEATMSRDGASANGDDWPSAKQINEKLAKWHELRTAMLSAWGAVPPERRAGLVAPPGVQNR